MFKLISHEELSFTILPLLKEKLPFSGIVYNTISLAVNKIYSDKVHTDVYAYCQNDVVDKDNLFVVCLQICEYYPGRDIVSIYPPENPTAQMISGVEKLINWNHVGHFGIVAPNFVSILDELCKRHGYSGSEPAILHYMDVEDALQLDTSLTEIQKEEGLCFTGIKEQDAELVVEKWKYAGEGAKGHILDSISSLGTSAIYSKNHAAAWVLFSPWSTVNCLYTLENFRRKGLAALVMKGITKHIASLGLITFAEVEPDNEASSILLQKLKFKTLYNSEWMYYKPN